MKGDDHFRRPYGRLWCLNFIAIVFEGLQGVFHSSKITINFTEREEYFFNFLALCFLSAFAGRTHFFSSARTLERTYDG